MHSGTCFCFFCSLHCTPSIAWPNPSNGLESSVYWSWVVTGGKSECVGRKERVRNEYFRVELCNDRERRGCHYIARCTQYAILSAMQVRCVCGNEQRQTRLTTALMDVLHRSIDTCMLAPFWIRRRNKFTAQTQNLSNMFVKLTFDLSITTGRPILLQRSGNGTDIIDHMYWNINTRAVANTPWTWTSPRLAVKRRLQMDGIFKIRSAFSLQFN